MKYTDFNQVPFYKKQCFFWLSFIFFVPISLVLLTIGDIYYLKKGNILSFGVANRIVAGAIGIFWLFMLWMYLPIPQ